MNAHAAPVHISSLLVTAKPELMAAVAEAIAREPAAEVAMTDPAGKIVVAMETDSEQAIVDALDRIQVLEGVVSAALVYHQMDEGAEPPSES